LKVCGVNARQRPDDNTAELGTSQKRKSTVDGQNSSVGTKDELHENLGNVRSGKDEECSQGRESETQRSESRVDERSKGFEAKPDKSSTSVGGFQGIPIAPRARPEESGFTHYYSRMRSKIKAIRNYDTSFSKSVTVRGGSEQESTFRGVSVLPGNTDRERENNDWKTAGQIYSSWKAIVNIFPSFDLTFILLLPTLMSHVFLFPIFGIYNLGLISSLYTIRFIIQRVYKHRDDVIMFLIKRTGYPRVVEFIIHFLLGIMPGFLYYLLLGILLSFIWSLYKRSQKDFSTKKQVSVQCVTLQSPDKTEGKYSKKTISGLYWCFTLLGAILAYLNNDDKVMVLVDHFKNFLRIDGWAKMFFSDKGCTNSKCSKHDANGKNAGLCAEHAIANTESVVAKLEYTEKDIATRPRLYYQQFYDDAYDEKSSLITVPLWFVTLTENGRLMVSETLGLDPKVVLRHTKDKPTLGVRYLVKGDIYQLNIYDLNVSISSLNRRAAYVANHTPSVTAPRRKPKQSLGPMAGAIYDSSDFESDSDLDSGDPCAICDACKLQIARVKSSSQEDETKEFMKTSEGIKLIETLRRDFYQLGIIKEPKDEDIYLQWIFINRDYLENPLKFANKQDDNDRCTSCAVRKDVVKEIQNCNVVKLQSPINLSKLDVSRAKVVEQYIPFFDEDDELDVIEDGIRYKHKLSHLKNYGLRCCREFKSKARNFDYLNTFLSYVKNERMKYFAALFLLGCTIFGIYIYYRNAEDESETESELVDYNRPCIYEKDSGKVCLHVRCFYKEHPLSQKIISETIQKEGLDSARDKYGMCVVFDTVTESADLEAPYKKGGVSRFRQSKRADSRAHRNVIKGDNYDGGKNAEDQNIYGKEYQYLTNPRTGKTFMRVDMKNVDTSKPQTYVLYNFTPDKIHKLLTTGPQDNRFVEMVKTTLVSGGGFGENRVYDRAYVRAHSMQEFDDLLAEGYTPVASRYDASNPHRSWLVDKTITASRDSYHLFRSITANQPLTVQDINDLWYDVKDKGITPKDYAERRIEKYVHESAKTKLSLSVTEEDKRACQELLKWKFKDGAAVLNSIKIGKFLQPDPDHMMKGDDFDDKELECYDEDEFAEVESWSEDVKVELTPIDEETMKKDYGIVPDADKAEVTSDSTVSSAVQETPTTETALKMAVAEQVFTLESKENEVKQAQLLLNQKKEEFRIAQAKTKKKTQEVRQLFDQNKTILTNPNPISLPQKIKKNDGKRNNRPNPNPEATQRLLHDAVTETKTKTVSNKGFETAPRVHTFHSKNIYASVLTTDTDTDLEDSKDVQLQSIINDDKDLVVDQNALVEILYQKTRSDGSTEMIHVGGGLLTSEGVISAGHLLYKGPETPNFAANDLIINTAYGYLPVIGADTNPRFDICKLYVAKPEVLKKNPPQTHLRSVKPGEDVFMALRKGNNIIIRRTKTGNVVKQIKLNNTHPQTVMEVFYNSVKGDSGYPIYACSDGALVGIHRSGGGIKGPNYFLMMNADYAQVVKSRCPLSKFNPSF